MSKTFRVEHIDYVDNPTLTITLWTIHHMMMKLFYLALIGK